MDAEDGGEHSSCGDGKSNRILGAFILTTVVRKDLVKLLLVAFRYWHLRLREIEVRVPFGGG